MKPEEEGDGYHTSFHERCWEHGDKESMLMHLVMAAKMELIKEKVKKRIEAEEGKKLDEIAGVLVQAKMDYHKKKMEMMEKKEEARERLEEIFGKD